MNCKMENILIKIILFWILPKKCVKSIVSIVITLTIVVKAPQNYYYSVKTIVSLVIIELLQYVSQ